ncbi:MAG: AmmeMemoRadiSam system protein A [Pyrodictiaceae archaeon]
MSDQIRPEELSDEEGVFLVRLARRAVEHYFEKGEKLSPPPETPSRLMRAGAAFVTITTYYTYEHRELRGCIGYIYPLKSLAETVIDVALEAAFRDPRFPPMEKEELEKVTFEVSVLSPLERLPENPLERVSRVVPGKHGVLVKKGFYQGLLLPEVPVEYLWDTETFLAETCVKAGLPPHCWLDEDTEVYVYYTSNWREVEPRGPIEKRILAKEYKEYLERYLSRA